MKMLLSAVLGLAAISTATTANAATFFHFDGVSGTFGHNNIAAGSFNDTFHFVLPTAGVFGSTISSIKVSNLTNVDFRSVTLNGTAFTTLLSGVVEARYLTLPVSGGEQTINVTVDELDLEAEGNQARARAGRGAGPEPETTAGFGLTLNNITPDIARQLRLESSRGAVVVDVDPNSPAARAGLTEGDVILRVGQTPVGNAADAQRELARVPSGGTAFLRVLREGQETFVPVTKE